MQKQQHLLEECKHNLGDFHPQVADVLTSIGLFHHHITGSQEHALRSYRLAMEVYQHNRDERREYQDGYKSEYTTDVKMGITLTDIGNAYESMENYVEATENYEKALEIYRYHGMEEDHPRALATSRCLYRSNRFVI